MYKEDIELAKKARVNAHAPYSNFFVGACLKCKNGNVYLGCNVENHGIQSICAERVAFSKAISEGEKEFASITIVGALKDDDVNSPCLPCGYCRQFISEFVDDDFKIITIDDDKEIVYSMNDLLPNNFLM